MSDRWFYGVFGSRELFLFYFSLTFSLNAFFPSHYAQDLLPHDLPWKEVRKKLNAAASKEKAAIMMTGDVAGRSAHTQEEDFKAPPRGENGGVDSDATSKSAGEEVTRSSEEGSPVGISITAADILQWQSKGGWWSFRGNQKEEVVA